jgi:NAD(P)-dependent dehydrogenase (short-subunit alcohol dehydrogenase family)
VLCADLNQNAANETVEIIREENGTANAICADVTRHDDIRRMVKGCTSTYYATKAAMIHITHTTAVQYAPKHIRVNAVLPGL